MACLVCGKDGPEELCLECEKLAKKEKREAPYHEKDGVPCKHQDLVHTGPSPFSMFEK